MRGWIHFCGCSTVVLLMRSEGLVMKMSPLLHSTGSLTEEFTEYGISRMDRQRHNLDKEQANNTLHKRVCWRRYQPVVDQKLCAGQLDLIAVHRLWYGSIPLIGYRLLLVHLEDNGASGGDLGGLKHRGRCLVFHQVCDVNHTVGPPEWEVKSPCSTTIT